MTQTHDLLHIRIAVLLTWAIPLDITLDSPYTFYKTENMCIPFIMLYILLVNLACLYSRIIYTNKFIDRNLYMIF